MSALADLLNRAEVALPLHEHLLGDSAAMREANALIERLAPSSLTVLISGETGTGKDIAARRLHKLSPRHGKPFVKVNCPSLPETIIESELFGHDRGAFTGARTNKPGRMELANSGTIFLDEITEIPPSTQSKLMQVLDGDPIIRVGGTRAIPIDVRILAATNVPLDVAEQSGRLRRDIGFRLSEVVVFLPSLRQRPEDIPLLTAHLLYHLCREHDKPVMVIEDRVIQEMQAQKWPGNVRELASRVKKFVATGKVDLLLEGEAEDSMSAAGTDLDTGANNGSRQKEFLPLKEVARRAAENAERAMIEEALQYTLWNRRKAAKLLHISYSSLLRRIEAYNIGKL
jgi:transcriptional regulator with PAS, ATPase and Fis domain